jgi:PAS domain S-box-containing protein
MNSPAGNDAGADLGPVSDKKLQLENDSLRERLREAEETLSAIRNGDVDAVVVSGADDVPRVYTLETADESYRVLVQEMQEGALTLTKAGDILYCNARLAQLVEIEQWRVVGGSLQRFIGESEWPSVLEMIDGESKGEVSVQTARGRRVPAHLSFSALRGGNLSGVEIYCCIVTDLTEQRRTGDQLRAAHAALLLQVAERERTERLLRQSQKMEAVGRLTGGIAHDFNNLLMVITGGLSILDRNPPPERHQKLRDGMRKAAERGAALTRQLLAFSRQKELHPKPISLPRHVEGRRALLDGSLGGDVTVKTEFAPDVWAVRCDEGELEIALLNLCVNARDAMPKGGTITIAARNRPDLREFELTGDFVEVSVTDTGEGMDPITVVRCLEPFFTTKDIGKGSGLGLAQVYGFAHGSGGSVQIESKVHEGTRVVLLLPRSEAPPESALVQPGCSADSMPEKSAASRVLLVEDDLAVASLTVDMLEELGYEVVRVDSAHAGLTALAEPHRFDLVLSDVMMPGGMNGISFMRELRHRGIELPVVLVSGYAEAVRRGPENAGVPLLAKPYGLDDLSQILNAAMSEHRERPMDVPREQTRAPDLSDPAG